MANTNVEDFKAAVAKKNSLYEQLYKDRQYQQIAALYTKNCRFLPQGMPAIVESGGIAEFWKVLVSMGFSSVTLKTAELVGPVGDYGFERAIYEFHDKDGKELQVGKYIIVWAYEDGEWKYNWEVFNADK